MSDLERRSVALLFVVAIAALLIKSVSCNGGSSRSPSRVVSQTSTGTILVTGGSVNLRQEPAGSASVLAQVGRGTELELLGTNKDWYNVKWGGGAAWLSKLYASPAEDCPPDQGPTSGALRGQLPGEWKGRIQGRPATFVFYVRGERLCAYVIYDNVKEALSVEEAAPAAVTLVGKRYERLNGRSGDYSLDTFTGQFDNAAGRLAGTYIDARSNRGEWFIELPASTFEAASTQPGESLPQPEEGDTQGVQAEPRAEDPALGEKVGTTAPPADGGAEDDSVEVLPPSDGLPMEDFGACPFAKCSFGVWLAEAATDVHRDRRQSSPVLFRVEPGERVNALRGAIVTTRLGNARAETPTRIGTSMLEAGVNVPVLRYAGDGMWVVWNGRTTSRVWIGVRARNRGGLQMEVEPKTEWWVEVRNESGQAGWTHQADQFRNPAGQ